MLLRRVTVRDCGPYRGEHTFEFDSGRTAVIGPNGSGKTTLLSLVRSVLTGKAIGEGYTEVRLETDEGSIVAYSTPLESAVEGGRGNTVVGDAAAAMMFFDGEDIRRYAVGLVQDTYTLAGLFGLEEHLHRREALKSSISSIEESIKVTREDPELLSLKESLDKALAALEGHRKAVDEWRRRLDEIEGEMEKAKESIARHRELESIRASARMLEGEVKRIKNGLSRVAKDVENLADVAYLAVIRDLVLHGIDHIEEMKELSSAARVHIGEDMNQIKMLNTILKSGKCICGTEIARSEEGKKSIEEMIDALVEDGRRYEAIASTEYLPSGVLRELHFRVASVPSREKALSVIKEDSNLSAELDEKETELAALKKREETLRNGLSYRTSAAAERAFRRLLEEKGAVKGRITGVEREIGEMEETLSSLQTTLDRVTSSIDERVKGMEKQKASLMVELNDLEMGIRNEVETRLEHVHRAAEEYFLAVCGKDVYTGLSPKDGMVFPLTRDGPVDPERLSDGERHLLIISLIAGLRAEARDKPLIMDAALGRLDSHHRKGVLDKLDKLGSQVVLLANDRELPVEEAGNCGFSRVYVLIPGEGGTKVEVVE